MAIARALASKPTIILADEPTGNLDSRNSKEVVGLLRVTGEQFAQTIVMITHNESLAQLCSRVIRIEDGRIWKSSIAGNGSEDGRIWKSDVAGNGSEGRRIWKNDMVGKGSETGTGARSQSRQGRGQR